MAYLVIAFTFGLSAGIVGRAKGSSFWIWFLIGAVVPVLGLIAAFLYRIDKDEPERQCPTCGKAVKLYVQVCPRCGTDLYLPDPEAVRHPGVIRVLCSPDRERWPALAPASGSGGSTLYRSQVRTIALAKPTP